MHVKIQQFLRQSHSWSYTSLNLARSFLKLNHEIDLIPTDMDKQDYMENDMKPYVRNKIQSTYDAQISYTAFHNIPKYLNFGTKNRFNIFCYEFNHGFPREMTKYHTFCDKILAPSNFAKEVFLNGGVPNNKIEIVPHGINLEDYENKIKYSLKTNKKFKILVNVAQCHIRKNIPAVFEAYGQAFNSKDDVCLVMKVVPKREGSPQPFDVNFNEIYKEFQNKYKNHGEIEIITNFIENITQLYNSCDAVFTMSHGEGFYLPGIETLGAGKLNITPRHGGQLDFLSDNNSLLIDGKIVRANKKMLYWNSNAPQAEMFQPNVEHAASLLQKAYKEYDTLIQQLSPNIKETAEKFTWLNATQKILDLCIT